MGLSKYIKNKVKERVVNYQAERAHQREERLENRNQYEKGYHEGQYTRGKKEGAGEVVAANRVGRSSGGRVQRTTGRGGFSSTMQKSDSIFGWSGGGGLGSGFGFGGEEPRRSGPPVRTRTISPSGKVTITEPIERRHEADEGLGGLGLGIDTFMGPSGSHKGKREKHPYEF